VARSSSGGVATCYVLSVLGMTSRMATKAKQKVEKLSAFLLHSKVHHN